MISVLAALALADGLRQTFLGDTRGSSLLGELLSLSSDAFEAIKERMAAIEEPTMEDLIEGLNSVREPWKRDTYEDDEEYDLDED